jgi:hypothetical protein
MRQCRNASELEQATLKSGAVAQNIGDVDKAMAGAVTKVEATFRPRSKLLPHSAMGGRRRCHAKPARVRARNCDGVFRLLCRRGDYSGPWSDYARRVDRAGVAGRRCASLVVVAAAESCWIFWRGFHPLKANHRGLA